MTKLRYRIEGSPVKLGLPDGGEIILKGGETFEVDRAIAERLLKTSDGYDDPRFEVVG